MSYYEYAKRVRAERNLLAAAFDRIASSGYVELRIACSLGIPGFLGCDFLQDYLKTHADVSISLCEMPDALCEAALREGLYDMALTVVPCDEEFESRLLYTSPVWYWVRRDDPLGDCESNRSRGSCGPTHRHARRRFQMLPRAVGLVRARRSEFRPRS